MPGPTDRADGFDAVPAALRGAAGTFASEADALTSATGSLQRHLGSIGGAPWGADLVGARFGAAYQPAADAVTINLGALAHGLARISGALVAVADRYEQADQAAVPTTTTTSTTGGRSGDPGRRTRAESEPAARRGRSNVESSPHRRRGGLDEAYIRGRRR